MPKNTDCMKKNITASALRVGLLTPPKIGAD